MGSFKEPSQEADCQGPRHLSLTQASRFTLNAQTGTKPQGKMAAPGLEERVLTLAMAECCATWPPVSEAAGTTTRMGRKAGFLSLHCPSQC